MKKILFALLIIPAILLDIFLLIFTLGIYHSLTEEAIFEALYNWCYN